VVRALRYPEDASAEELGVVAGEDDDLLMLATTLQSLVEEHREAERKLRESEARLRLLAENSTDILGRYDAQGYCLYVSPACRALTGYEPEELIGKHFTVGFNPDDHDQIANLDGVMLGESDVITFSYRFRRKDGSYVWLETAVHAIRDPETGLVVESHTASRDITERKEAANELEKMNRLLTIERDRQKEHLARLEELNVMKSEFVSSVSHELRTPLASILGFAQTIIIDPELPVETRQEFLQIIVDEGKRLAKLINDLLDLARIENGRVALEATRTDLLPVIRRALQSVRMQADAKSLTIRADLPTESLPATFDVDRILQVMINLLGNAVKFTPSGGSVGVRASVQESDVVIQVDDTGLGIPKSDIPHLFEKFYRVHRPGMEIRGTGLGLAIARHSVELHGGSLTVQSEENKGSTFTIRFPLR
jgi:PAS domain S-box-containing protein